MYITSMKVAETHPKVNEQHVRIYERKKVSTMIRFFVTIHSSLLHGIGGGHGDHGKGEAGTGWLKAVTVLYVGTLLWYQFLSK